MKKNNSEEVKLRTPISRKILISVLLMAFLLGGTGIFIGYTVYSQTMDDVYIDNTVKLARTAAAIVDRATVEKYTREILDIYSTLTKEEIQDEEAPYLYKFEHIEEEEDWQFLRKQLQKIGKENELTSILIAALDRPAHSIIYVVDSDDTETYCPPGLVDDSMTDEEINDFVNSTAVITNTEEYGWLTSGAAPMYNEDGTLSGFVIIDISMNEVMHNKHSFLFVFFLALAAITAAMSFLLTLGLRFQIVVPINKLANAAEEYANDRSRTMDESSIVTNHFSNLGINTGDEVQNLASVMGEMETQLGEYIVDLTRVTAEKERIGAELSVATQIQMDMLPRIFPAFPGRDEFDIFATMTPAKEVGGDFYDFFLVDDDHIALVMADVSGKGVPAALFMVIAKTLIKNRAQMGYSPAELLETVNNQLCEGNEAELFVTVWIAIVEISTGKGVAANAGHEHPVICRNGGQYELVIYRHSPAVAMMEDMIFQEHEFQLNPGDRLYVYTDGVPEATDANNCMFGTDRMLQALNDHLDAKPEESLHHVKAAIDQFVGDAPQFDDITMLGFTYWGMNGKKKSDELQKVMETAEKTTYEVEFEATVENLLKLQAYVEGLLEDADVPVKKTMLISLAVEEIFVNIVNYAYAPGTGMAKVVIEMDKNPSAIHITFYDSGTPYDPLAKEDPDITLSAEERKIGGLGVYLTKTTMDEVSYEYKDGQNVFRMTSWLNA